jgi:phosphoheptose isomerase
MQQIDELIDVLSKSRALQPQIRDTGEAILACLKSGGRLLTCGNGGSAADAMHLAEELVGRYNKPRRPLAAICLNGDPTALTCIANDFGFDEVYSRQVTALGQAGDILVGFTTSGNSPNVLAAFAAGKANGLRTILVGGKDGGKARGQCDFELIVPSANTARIQEVHTLILHSWLDAVDGFYATAAGS